MDIEKDENKVVPEENNNEVVLPGMSAPKAENIEDSKIEEEKDNENEVTFTFGGVGKAEEPDNNEKMEEAKSEEKVFGETSEQAEEEDDGVVFAAAEKPATTHRIAQQRFAPAKKKFPKVPVIAGALAIVCVAAVGAAVALTNGGSAEVVTSDDGSQVSEESKAAGTSDEEDVISAQPVIREESAEIKTINTSTITFGKNISVSGVDVSGKTLSEAYDALQDRIKELRDEVNITIQCDSKSVILTQDDFKFDTDLANVLIQAYHYSRGELDDPTIDTTKENGVTDFTVTSVINKNSVTSAVKKVAEKFDVQPVDAHVKSFNPDKKEKFTYADGSDGYLISQKVVNEEITSILEQSDKTGAFTVKAVRTPYKVTLEQVKANTKLIASHCTTANNVWASVQNMELAIKTCNGYVVKAGETFSFNEMTGDTTTGDLGYVPSTAIVEGRYEQQYGGGICQASTTIYNAAMKAGMEAIERYAHAYPSVYADRGLDATVDYGNLDMKFKNNFDYPVYIATYVYDYNGDGMDELCVEFYGPISAEYDEIVVVGWVDSIYSSGYTAKGAQVYFKDGKEVKREYLPSGSYDFHYDSYYSVESLMPSDPEYGPKDVKPTNQTPTIYSPNGCGSSAPIPYGTASTYLRQSTKVASQESKKTSDD